MNELPQVDLNDINPTTVWVIITFFIMGVVELVKRINEAMDERKEDASWGPVYTIAGAALAGAVVMPLFGNFFLALNQWQLAVVGMVLGFNASGAITFLSYFGKKATSPVEVVVPASTSVPVIEQPELETEEQPGTN